MKNLFLKFIVGLIFISACTASYAQTTTADLIKQNEELKKQVQELTEKLKKLEETYISQTKEEISRYSKLREENRALRAELKAFKATSKNTPKAPVVETTAAPAQKAQAGMIQEGSKEDVMLRRINTPKPAPVKKVEEQPSAQPVVEDQKETPQTETKKSSSFWDNAFPF